MRLKTWLARHLISYFPDSGSERSGAARIRRRPNHAEVLEDRTLLTTVQVDLSGLFNLDGIANKPTAAEEDFGDNPAIDGNSSLFVTNSFAANRDPIFGNGLPDDGFFPANGFHPDIQLGYSNEDNGNNIVQLTDTADSVAIDVPDGTYTQLHLAISSSAGSSGLDVQLNYSDGSVMVSSFVVWWFDDVFDGSAEDDSVVYNLVQDIDHYRSGELQGSDDASLFGHRFAVDATRTLESITVTGTFLDPNSVLLFGATLVESLYVVDVVEDVDNGNFNAGDLSLREAIGLANASPGPDTIVFTESADISHQTIVLSGTELLITDSVTIAGPGAGIQAIDANNASRIFNIDDSDSGNHIEVEISGLTLTGGLATDGNGGALTDGDKGGAIFSRENLTLRDSVVSGSTAVIGGGVYDSHFATIIGSRISDNSASTNAGGFGNLGDATIRDSSITGNTATTYGGGVATQGTLTITNSTVAGNTAGSGGGLYNVLGSADVRNSTIAGNTASTGGGVFNGDTATLHNSIVAGNREPSSTANDVAGPSNLAAGSAFNLIGDATTAGGLLDGQMNNIVDVPWITVLENDGVDPIIKRNGGGTDTVALLESGDPARDAVDAGDPGFDGSSLPWDQRSAPFERIVNGQIDIGAYERQFLANSFFEVTTLTNEFNYANADISLREAINNANGSVGLDTIAFAAPLTSGGYASILLDGEELRISDDANIVGPGPHLLTIDADFESRIFNVDDGHSGSKIAVEISGLDLHYGFTADIAGAVLSSEDLTLRNMLIEDHRSDFGAGIYVTDGITTVIDSTISDNSANSGAGIYTAAAGQLAVIDSTLMDNRASIRGGGVFNEGNADIRSSTIYRNRASDDGAGIYNNGTASVTASTVARNTATDSGGGILNQGTATIGHSTVSGNIAAADGGISNTSTATLTHTIVAGNRLAGGADSDIGGAANVAATSSFNLVGDDVNSGGLTDGPQGNIVGVDWKTVLENDGTDPTLKFSGGPTYTIGLLPSADPARDAIDAGDPAFDDTPQPQDQRGAPFDRIADSVVDIGAVERQVLSALDFEVTTILDVVNDTDFVTSLREALNAANGSVGSDIITFNPLVFSSPQTISLLLGELPIGDSVTISVPVSDRVTIDAQQQSRVMNAHAFAGDIMIDGLHLTGGRTDGPTSAETSGAAIIFEGTGTLTFSNSIIDNNDAGGFAGGGGGIFFPGTFGGTDRLVINDSTISGNTANSRGGAVYSTATDVVVNNSTISGNFARNDGGGLHTASGELRVNDSVIADNSAYDGGGLHNDQGHTFVHGTTVTRNSAENGGGLSGNQYGATITESTFSNNTSNYGGAAWTFNGDLTVSDSTISGNSARFGGGFNTFRGDISLTNSTVSGNTATRDGGGLYTYNGTITVQNSTISGNSAGDDGGGLFFDDSETTVRNSTITNNTSGDYGGGIGIYIDDAGEKLFVFNSIIAENDAPTGPDFVAPGGAATNLTVSSSLIGNGKDTTLAESQTPDPVTGNLVGDALSGGLIDPGLDPLSNNGGPTLTHQLDMNSPAIDAGDNSLVLDANDQRMAPFIRIVDGGSGSATVDMGAYEWETLGPSFFVVDTLDDELNYDNATVSLREAINSANGNPGPDTISMTGLSGSILLSLGDLHIADSLTIVGPGADLLTISGNGLSRVFTIDDGDSDSASAVSLSGLTIADGFAGRSTVTGDNLNGGGILSREDLTISDSVLTNNTAASGGGAIDHNNNSLTIINSSITNNTAGLGGGIVVDRAGLLVQNSSVTGNQATSGNGGGLIFTTSTADPVNGTIINSTVSENSAVGEGGGIINDRSSLDVANSTIARNSAADNGGGIFNRFFSTLVLTNSTVAGNTTTGAGGGLFNDPATTVTINNTVFAGNSKTGGTPSDIEGDPIETVSVSNLIGDALTAGGLAHDNDGDLLTGSNNIVGVDWKTVLDNHIDNSVDVPTLIDNGGPTETIALLPGSPAIDAGADLSGSGITTDQRGNGRPTGNSFDIGAYEVGLPPSVDIDGNNDSDASTDGILAIRFMFGFTGEALTQNAVGTGATNETDAELETILQGAAAMLDVDGNGDVNAATDGILFIRYLFGFEGDVLVEGAVGPGATRTTGQQVTDFLAGFEPPVGPGGLLSGVSSGGDVTISGLESGTPTFQWNAAPGANSFRLMIERRSDGHIMETAVVQEPAYTAANLLAQGAYRVWIDMLAVDGVSILYTASAEFSIAEMEIESGSGSSFTDFLLKPPVELNNKTDKDQEPIRDKQRDVETVSTTSATGSDVARALADVVMEEWLDNGAWFDSAPLPAHYSRRGSAGSSGL